MRRRSSPRAMAFLIGLLLAVSGVLGLSAGLSPAWAAGSVPVSLGATGTLPSVTFQSGDDVVFDNPSGDDLTVAADDPVFPAVTVPAGSSRTVSPSGSTTFRVIFYQDIGGDQVPDTRATGTLTMAADDPTPTPTDPTPTDPTPTDDPTPSTDPTPTDDPTPSTDPTTDPTNGPVTPVQPGTPTTVPDPVTGLPIPATVVNGVVVPLPSGSSAPPSAGSSGSPAGQPGSTDEGGGTEPNESDGPQDGDEGIVSQATDFLLTAGGLVQPPSPRRWGVPIVLAVVLLAGVGSLVVRVVRSTRGRPQ